MLYIRHNTTEEYTHTSEWKVIYTNDIDAKIELHFEVDKLLGLKKQITAGEELTNAHQILQTTRNGTLTATKGDSEENKNSSEHIKCNCPWTIKFDVKNYKS